MRAEEALRTSERRYRSLYERNPAGFFRSTFDGRILECNESFARMYGYASPADALDTPAHEFYPADADRELWVERLLKERALVNQECRGKRRAISAGPARRVRLARSESAALPALPAGDAGAQTPAPRPPGR